MWTAILSFIGGPIVKGLIDAYRLKLQAKTQADSMAVDLAKTEIEGEIAARQVEASLLRQEQGWWVTAIIRPLMAFPFVVWTWKVVIYDKVMGLGTTDPLTGQIGQIAMIVITGYFGGRTIEKVARIFKK